MTIVTAVDPLTELREASQVAQAQLNGQIVVLREQHAVLARRILELEASNDITVQNMKRIEERFALIQTGLRAAGNP